MDTRWQVAVLVGHVVLVVGCGLLARLVAWVNRPVFSPGPPTPDLIPTPPAVVNLLLNGLVAAPAAAAATLLDLSARGHVRLHQPGDDPADTVVTVHRYLNRPTDYERRVLERIMVPAGVRPLTLRDLSRRHTEDNSDWYGRLAREVRADAVQRGLIRPGHESPAVNVIIAGYLLPFMLSCLAAPALTELLGVSRTVPAAVLPAIVVAVVVMLGITVVSVNALAGNVRTDGLTPEGRKVAAHWAGVATWLRGHEEFADLPPASVTVWDAYLAHGVAVGAAIRAASILHLGAGTADVVRGRGDRLLRVRYPSASKYRLNISSGRRLVLSLVGLAVVVGLALSPARPAWLLVVLAGLALRFFYRVVRATIDLVAPQRITGEVVRLVPFNLYDLSEANQGSHPLVSGARSRSAAAEAAGRPTRGSRRGGSRRTADGVGVVHAYFVVLDDGRTDAVRAWWVTPEQAPRFRPGTTVTATVEPWSACVVAVDTVAAGRVA